MTGWGRSLCRGAFRLALSAFPRDFRRRHRLEMTESFEAGLDAAARRGAVRAGLYALRAVADAVGQGWTERTRRAVPPGHGASTQKDGEGIMGGWWSDVRLAVRSLRRSPGFLVAAVGVLALGIGANATVFSALRSAILAPPPFPDADRLVFADLTLERHGAPPDTMSWSYPKFRTFVDAPDRLVDPAAGYALRQVTLSDAGPPTRVGTELVSPGYFALLGMTPVVGRAFGADEDDPADPPLVAVLSHELWRGRFGGDRAVVGSDVTLNGRRVQVVGVAPEGFRGLTGGAEVWIPMAAAGEVVSAFMIRGTHAHWMRVVGRLRPSTTFEAARDQMASVGAAVADAHPWPDEGYEAGATARRFEDVRINRGARSAVLLLTAGAGLVLLVACANLSGLLLARARRRDRDGAVRRALGASRWRLVRSAAVESGVLAAVGGAAGVLLATWGTGLMAAAWPDQFLRSGDGEMRVVAPETFGVDGSVLLFVAGVSVLATLLLGAIPALRVSRADLAERMKEGSGAGRRGERMAGVDARAWLVAGQVALAVVLLVGSGLVGVSMKRLLDVDRGFAAERVLTFRYDLPRESSWRDDPAAFQEALVERLAALPGAEAAAVGIPPLGGHWSITTVHAAEGRPPYPDGEQPAIGINIVTPGYFEALGIDLLQGRYLDESDGTDSAPSVVLNRLAAETLFPDGGAVGRHVELGISDEGKDAQVEVVGVVADVVYSAPDQERIPEAYYAAREFPLAGGTVSVRTAGDPETLSTAARGVVQELDAQAPVYAVATLADALAEATGDRRVILGLLGLFSLVTLLLAATGTWGVVSYAVADRRRELGLRLALGAGSVRVQGMVVRASLVAGVVGVIAGLAGAWAGSRLLDTFLFQTSTRDPLAFAGGAALILVVVVAASWLPARRATRVDPVEALRAE